MAADADEEEHVSLLQTDVRMQRSAVVSTEKNQKPHILVILADDLGHANVGFTRKEAGKTREVSTPNIDGLASEGVILEHMYVHYMCSPSRSAIQSGRYPIHVNVVQTHIMAHNEEDPVGGFAGIPRNMTGLGEVMRKGGYKTHFVGKWDAGMATPDHTPAGRGYDTALNFFGHENDYWNHASSHKCGSGKLKDLWLMNKDTKFPGEPAHGLINSPECSEAKQDVPKCRYEDDIFVEEIKGIIRNHEANTPLFIFWAPHAPHGPLQVPKQQLMKFQFIDFDKRQKYNSMVNYLDNNIGVVVTALKQAKLYENTLVVFSSDNGGPIMGPGNNYPLKGGKYSNFEGGIRVPAFVSGGFLPSRVRNTRESGLMAGWDWYATFASLAGVDPTDEKAAKAGLPPIDSVNLWPLLSGNTEKSPRDHLLLSSTKNGYNGRKNGDTVVAGIIAPPLKIVLGQFPGDKEPFAAWFSKVDSPNVSSPHDKELLHDLAETCGRTPDTGCMYNVWEDSGEYANIAKMQPQAFRNLLDKIDDAQKRVYNPTREAPKKKSLVETNVCGQAPMAAGFLGPFLP
jgi:arylsulfatase I/J